MSSVNEESNPCTRQQRRNRQPQTNVPTGPPPGFETVTMPHLPSEHLSLPPDANLAPPGLDVPNNLNLNRFGPPRSGNRFPRQQPYPPMPSSSILSQATPTQKFKNNYRPNNNHKRHPNSNRYADNSNEECILCCHRAKIFGIGECRHPACMECMIRMRCLSGLTKCHACRDEIPIVHFVNKPATWDEYKLPSGITGHDDCDKFKICFETKNIEDQYNKLNSFTCKVCSAKKQFAEFSNFNEYKRHLSADHKLMFCHICLEHLNILPRRQQIFDSKQLKNHMDGRNSKLQDVRGHPKCQFCPQRFFDDDELYKHLRKDHFFCGLCATIDGVNVFYKFVEQLHRHYEREHYPCPHKDCVELGIVFANEFDLNVHEAEQHNENNGRIQVNFHFSHGSSHYNAPTTRVSNQNSGGHAASSAQSLHSSSRSGQEFATSGLEEFPALCTGPTPPTISNRIATYKQPAVLEEEFPSLSLTPATSVQNSKINWNTNAMKTRSEAQKSMKLAKQEVPLASQFPSLGDAPSSSRGVTERNNVWSSEKTMEIIKKPPQVCKPSPKPERKKFVPAVEAWPENMQRKLEARALGLPEPEDLEPPLPQPPLDDQKRKPNKEKKPKKKTIGLEVLKKRLNNPQTLAGNANACRFIALNNIS